MNYFAHLHIAYETQTSWAGNLMGDFSVSPDELADDLYLGWRLHQQIDIMVDAHPASERFRSLPRKGRRRFSGIVLDIIMDYWLIQHWSAFCDLPLERFCECAVSGLIEDYDRCPESLKKMILSLQQHNWLANLGSKEGVSKALGSVMRRWKYGHHLSPFLEHLPEVIQQGEKPFLDLYPDVLNFARKTAEKR